VGDRLIVDIGADWRVSVGFWREGVLAGGSTCEATEVAWPLDGKMMEDLRWYLEDYLEAPYAVYEDRGVGVAGRLDGWGEEIFQALFGSGSRRDVYRQSCSGASSAEVVLRSASPAVLGLPWELLRDPSTGSLVALDPGVSRSLPSVGLASAEWSGDRLRVLMVISRPAGRSDVRYRMVARPLLERLDLVRGAVDVVVLRPPTLAALREALSVAMTAGRPFQVVHFDGHGTSTRHAAGLDGAVGADDDRRQTMLLFEGSGGGRDVVSAATFARVIAEAKVPVVVLNACESGAVGKTVEAAVATRVLQEGAAAVVAMAYSVYAVAAAEFMAAFYERLICGCGIAEAVSAGRRRLFDRNRRPSPKGPMALADWLVPVHYWRRDVRFPGFRVEAADQKSLDDALDRHDRVDDRQSDEGPPATGSEPAGCFVGRDALFYDLENRSRTQRVVLLHGPAGIGKTELAKAFGRWWAETGGVEFPHWVIFHSFEPGVASFGLDGVIMAVGLQVLGVDFLRRGHDERQAEIENLLTNRKLLLILDNFETVASMPDPTGATAPLGQHDLDEMRGFLQRRAASGSSAVIVTSRTDESWLGNLRRIPVAGLQTAEAVEYAEQLLAACPAAAPRRARPVFGELLERLDGHPLAMRLVLPHLQTTEPETLVAALGGVGEMPGGAGGGGGRMTSLAASVAYSFDHLPAAGGRLLVVLCLLYGVADTDTLTLFSQTSEAPERFKGATKQSWGDALENATAVGLLSRLGEGMYRIVPAVPAFVAARWRDEEPADYDRQRRAATVSLIEAYAARCARLLHEIRGGDADMAYTVIGIQRRTLGAVLGLALDAELWEQAQAIVEPLDEYWDDRGLYEEAGAWVARVRAAIKSPGRTVPPVEDPAGSLWLFLVGSQANRELRAGNLEQSESTYRDIIEMLRTQPPSQLQQRGLAAAYTSLGYASQHRGHLEDAEGWYRQSFDIEEELGDRAGLAGTYFQLGRVAQLRGQLDHAEDQFRHSLAIKIDLVRMSTQIGPTALI
jgi:tetratricopeptide (TPR) repeat protein/tRNA A37 threonylcarbamoyladenosine biosynthesis protein TsaE